MGTEFGKGRVDVENRGWGVAVVGCDRAVEVTTSAGYGADAGVEQAIMVVRIAGVEKERFSPFQTKAKVKCAEA